MTRVRRGPKGRQRKNKILKMAKGFHFDRRTKIRHAMPTVERALHYTYASRKLLKRDMRKLWIIRINAAARELGTTYSKLMSALTQKQIAMNRKMLADLAATNMAAFKVVVESAGISPVVA